MKNFWLTHYEHSAVGFMNEPLKQVGKTIRGVEVAPEQVELIVNTIVHKLGLNASDTLVDLCCGNGLLTSRLAMYSGEVIGVDFSAGLLEVARSISIAANIQYVRMDVTELSESIIEFGGKYSMYEALQHLSPDDFEHILNQLGHRDGPIKFFVGGVPDQTCLRRFYVSDNDYSFYLEREASGRPHLGRWWTRNELRQAAKRAGFELKIIPQPPELYTSHYRFDALLERSV